jgi:hypothetical protein
MHHRDPKARADQGVSEWALVVSNHRPPPCKGVSAQASYLLKRANGLIGDALRSARVDTDWHRLAYVVLPFCLLG